MLPTIPRTSILDRWVLRGPLAARACVLMSGVRACITSYTRRSLIGTRVLQSGYCQRAPIVFRSYCVDGRCPCPCYHDARPQRYRVLARVAE